MSSDAECGGPGSDITIHRYPTRDESFVVLR